MEKFEDPSDDEPPSLVPVQPGQESLVEEQREGTQQSQPAGTVTKVPITIVTGWCCKLTLVPTISLMNMKGYLGAGKTTLMNYMLKEQHGKRIAVILNGS